MGGCSSVSSMVNSIRRRANVSQYESVMAVLATMKGIAS